jgi:hypothetical protein
MEPLHHHRAVYLYLAPLVMQAVAGLGHGYLHHDDEEEADDRWVHDTLWRQNHLCITCPGMLCNVGCGEPLPAQHHPCCCRAHTDRSSGDDMPGDAYAREFASHLAMDMKESAMRRR